MCLGHGIGHAVPEVQARRMPALAEAVEGCARKHHMPMVERDNGHAGFLKPEIDRLKSIGVVLPPQHQMGFEQRRRADEARKSDKERTVEIRVGLIRKGGDQHGRIDGDHRGEPSAP